MENSTSSKIMDSIKGVKSVNSTNGLSNSLSNNSNSIFDSPASFNSSSMSNTNGIIGFLKVYLGQLGLLFLLYYHFLVLIFSHI